MLPRVITLAQMLLDLVLCEGDYAIDATVGRGYDTAWLAEKVGPTGRVLGFDIQAEAIAHARERLETAGFSDRVTLIHAGHETLQDHVEAVPLVKAFMFNLGFLPKGDPTQVTRPQTTFDALTQAFPRLAQGGLISVAVYPGHPGGAAEAEAVLAWADSLDTNLAEMATYTPLKTRQPSPWLLVVSRRR